MAEQGAQIRPPQVRPGTTPTAALVALGLADTGVRPHRRPRLHADPRRCRARRAAGRIAAIAERLEPEQRRAGRRGAEPVRQGGRPGGAGSVRAAGPHPAATHAAADRRAHRPSRHRRAGGDPARFVGRAVRNHRSARPRHRLPDRGRGEAPARAGGGGDGVRGGSRALRPAARRADCPLARRGARRHRRHLRRARRHRRRRHGRPRRRGRGGALPRRGDRGCRRRRDRGRQPRGGARLAGAADPPRRGGDRERRRIRGAAPDPRSRRPDPAIARPQRGGGDAADRRGGWVDADRARGRRDRAGQRRATGGWRR